MRASFQRKSMLDAFASVSSVAPARSPKPILTSVKLTVSVDGIAELSATDLECGVRHRVLGVTAEQPGSAILPTQRFGQILRASNDDELTIEAEADKLVVRGRRSEFKLPSEDPTLFPDVPEFTAADYWSIAAADLWKLIRRTIYATDTESSRFALGGVLHEFGDGKLRCVGTDGRRLACAEAVIEAEGSPTAQTPAPVVPVKALKLIERLLDEDGPPVHIATTSSGITLRTELAVVHSRLVEGRFPRWTDVFPKEVAVTIPLVAGDFLSAIEQAAIATSEETRGVDFDFGVGTLTLKATAADVGASHVDLPIAHEGSPVEITFDPKYLSDTLKTLDDDAELKLDLIDGKNAGVLRTDDGLTVCVMPLTRER